MTHLRTNLKRRNFLSKCLEDDPMPVSRSTVAPFEHTGTDSPSYRELTWMLSLRIALDLFDAEEMLEVILDENELSHEIPRRFEKGIIVVVCFSFLLSTLQLLEIKLDYGDWKPRKWTSESRKSLQILLVNCVCLGLRLTIYLKYGKDVSIFIAKNGIIIILSLFEICSRCEVCGCHDY